MTTVTSPTAKAETYKDIEIFSKHERRARQDQVLSLFAESGKLIESCKKAGVNHVSHYGWLQTEPEYAERFELAKEMIADRLEQEIWRRAHDGVPVKVGWYQGVAGGVEQKYSDNLAMFRMRALRPNDYRESVQVTNDTNIHITVDDARARLVAMMQRNPALIDQVRETMGDAAVTDALEGGGGPPIDGDVMMNSPPQYSAEANDLNNSPVDPDPDEDCESPMAPRDDVGNDPGRPVVVEGIGDGMVVYDMEDEGKAELREDADHKEFMCEFNGEEYTECGDDAPVTPNIDARTNSEKKRDFKEASFAAARAASDRRGAKRSFKLKKSTLKG